MMNDPVPLIRNRIASAESGDELRGIERALNVVHDGDAKLLALLAPHIRTRREDLQRACSHLRHRIVVRDAFNTVSHCGAVRPANPDGGAS